MLGIERKRSLPWWVKAWIIVVGANVLLLLGIILITWGLFASS